MTDFPSLLPGNSSQLQRDTEQVIAGFINDLPVAYIKNVHNPKLCREDFSPWLAWEWSVDSWEGDWKPEIQRAVIWNSPKVHRHKGTLGSVELALTATGYPPTQIVEGYIGSFHDGVITRNGDFDRAGADHWAEYRVYLDRPISIEQAAMVRKILKYITPARSRLKGLYFTQALHLHNNKITRNGTYSRGVA